MADNEIITASNEDAESRLRAYSYIPYNLVNSEIVDTNHSVQELEQILKFYLIYKKGKSFTTEGSSGDYIPSAIKYKMIFTLINKEARFLFGEKPDIEVSFKGNYQSITEQDKNGLSILNDLVETILDKNNFEQKLLISAKDCFIGKRVACLVNFDSEDLKTTITFLPAMDFIYDISDSSGELIKFVSYTDISSNDSRGTKKKYFKKKYTKEESIIYLEEVIVDGTGREEIITEKVAINLPMIPAVVILNDGLLNDVMGESEIESLLDYEGAYSKLSNSDIDSLRKSMNPIRYTRDMERDSTKNLSSSAGAFWDLQTDQNLDNPNPEVGMLESSIGYSESLNNTLSRIRQTAYDQLDVPDISMESMKGIITSGKALKALYWSLIERSKEKMKTWGPAIKRIIEIIIEGSREFPDITKTYVKEDVPEISYTIDVGYNNPLPEDESEQKIMDLQEVNANAMSRKSYLKKWRRLQDAEVEEELKQIALEKQMLDSIQIPGTGF